jgi:hypothetical protein
MRKAILMLGTLLIAVILISGPAVAVWYYIFDITDYDDCTNITNIVGAEDSNDATIGQNPIWVHSMQWALVKISLSLQILVSARCTIYR